MNQRTESTWDVLMKTAVMRYRKEGQGVITRGGANEPPFSAPWHDWRPDTQWPVPTLPSGAPFVEMAAAGVDNGWALQALCSHWGIAPSEVIAVGADLQDPAGELGSVRFQYVGSGDSIGSGILIP